MLHVKIPRSLGREIRSYIVAHRYAEVGGRVRIGAFVIEALTKHLADLRAVPETFELAWARAHPGMPPPCKAEKQTVYQVHFIPVPGSVVAAPRLYNPELQHHFDTSRWDTRTWELIQEQIAQRRALGDVGVHRYTFEPPEPPRVEAKRPPLPPGVQEVDGTLVVGLPEGIVDHTPEDPWEELT